MELKQLYIIGLVDSPEKKVDRGSTNNRLFMIDEYNQEWIMNGKINDYNIHLWDMSRILMDDNQSMA